MKIRSDILRIYQSLHTWVGICAGVFLFIAFFAGALTMFKRPIDDWMASAPSSHLQGVSAAQIDSLVAAAQQQYPATTQRFQIQFKPDHTAYLSWTETRVGRALDLNEKRWHATLNAQGQLVAVQVVPSKLADLIDQLHRTAGIPGMIGDEHLGVYVMGVASVLYFLALVSGIILLLPTLVKDFFALRPGKNRKRFWLDAHNIIGISSLPFHVVICLSAMVFAFHDQYYDALNQFVLPPEKIEASNTQVQKPSGASELLAPSLLLEKIRAQSNQAEIHGLEFMGLHGARPMLRVALNNPRYLVRGPESGYLILHPYTGKTLNANMVPGKEGTWMSLIAPFFSLHFGSYGGDFVRWIYFLLGLCGAFLFYSGNLLWLEKRRKNQAQQTRSNRWMAAATVGICLGSVNAVLTCLLAGLCLQAFYPEFNNCFVALYYTVFLSALVWAFWRGAAYAAIDLLKLASLLAFALPISSALAMRSGNRVIDGLSIAAALIFAYAAKKTAQRVRHGVQDSVWAKPARA